jgi:colanic acid biosynthesis glycosyl transferase WcaI
VKILYVSQYFPPEMGAPAARAGELAHHWARAGHQVSILTGFPNHPTGVVPAEWRARLWRLVHHERISAIGAEPAAAQRPDSEAAGFDVYRTWVWPLPNRKTHERMRNYASFCLSAAVRGLGLPRPDVIIATSPQLLVALAGWWLAFARRLPFVFEVRDLWPESLTAVGVGNEHSLLHRSLAKLAGFLYARADLIVVVTPAFREYLIEHWRVPAEKIAVVENGVETEVFCPQPDSANCALRHELGVEDAFLVCYVGTMGMAHGLETLLDAAAELLEQRTDVLFLLVGEGAEKARIRSLAESRRLTNVRFLDQQPRERIPAFISASDACLVLLRKTDIFKTVIPTKMLEFMSCARPVILGVDGQARQIVEEANAGIVIEPENAGALVQAIHQLASDQALRFELGQNGRRHISERFSRAETARKFAQILRTLGTVGS